MGMSLVHVPKTWDLLLLLLFIVGIPQTSSNLPNMGHGSSLSTSTIVELTCANFDSFQHDAVDLQGILDVLRNMVASNNE